MGHQGAATLLNSVEHQQFSGARGVQVSLPGLSPTKKVVCCGGALLNSTTANAGSERGLCRAAPVLRLSELEGRENGHTTHTRASSGVAILRS
jgi:hypothetical protein